MRPSSLLSGRVDSLVFEANLQQVFGFSLRPGQIVLLDSLSAPTSACVVELVTNHGVIAWYLPTCSPDLSPIELQCAAAATASHTIAWSTTLSSSICRGMKRVSIDPEARIACVQAGATSGDLAGLVPAGQLLGGELLPEHAATVLSWQTGGPTASGRLSISKKNGRSTCPFWARHESHRYSNAPCNSGVE
jgi:hypothetical protein